MADNEIIKVQFPDKMKVTSPEIDSILKVSERISNWLHNDLKHVIEPLMVLHAVPDLLKEVNTTVVNQFTNLFQGQIEADVIHRQATIKVLNKKIASTENHIGQKEENLDKTLERINTRYDGLSDQLNKEHETFLKKLDSHAYEILDRIYYQQVQERFSYDSLPVTSLLADHAMVSATDRTICLEKGFSDAFEQVTNYVEVKQSLADDTIPFQCNELSEGIYDLPFCFIETEDRQTGERHLECLFECELENEVLNSELDFLREEMKNLAIYAEPSTEFYGQAFSAINPFLIEHLPESERQRFLSDMEEK
jgi:hypothetical protein